MKHPSSLLVLGLMSGTSADSIDVALVRISGRPPRLRASLEHFADIPMPATVRAAVLRLGEGTPVTTAEISQLNFRLGEVFGRASLAALKRFRVSPRRVALIGSHGQTVYHQGAASKFLGARVASTLQIGEPACIAAITGIPVVADFRTADMAVGGQGAPLVPFVDYLLYRHPRRGRVALNIGGIANITVVPPAAAPRDVFGFDTGPGNMVVDALVHHFTHGRARYDRNARRARAGQWNADLLNWLFRDTYYSRRPPKTAGREQYGHDYVGKLLAWGRRHRTPPNDLIRAATALTPLSIVHSLRRFVLPRVPVHDVFLSGGGARNPVMMELIRSGLKALGNIQLRFSSDVGVPEDAKEAFAFAILAYETFHRRPANIPPVTGAKKAAILGKLVYPPKVWR